MRILVASDAGLRVVRWIEGERTGSVVVKRFEGAAVTSLASLGKTTFAAVAGAGVQRSDDAGESWAPVGGDLAGADAATLRAGPSGELLVGTEPAGLFVSRDSGESWSALAGFAALADTEHWKPYGGKEAHVEAIAFDRHDPRRLYAGVEIGGVYRSDDGGTSWLSINDGIFDDIHDLLVDPRNGSRLFAATGGGLYTSPDRGADWRAVGGDIAGRYCTRIHVDGTTFLVGSAGGPSSGWGKGATKADARMWMSRDSGSTWEPAEPNKTRDASPITAFAGDPRARGTVLAGTAGGHLLYGVLESGRWQQMQYGLGRVRSVLVL